MRSINSFFTKIAIIGMIIGGLSYILNPSLEKIGQGGQLIAQAAIPWWISVIQFIGTTIGGTLGAIGILILLYLVMRSRKSSC